MPFRLQHNGTNSFGRYRTTILYLLIAVGQSLWQLTKDCFADWPMINQIPNADLHITKSIIRSIAQRGFPYIPFASSGTLTLAICRCAEWVCSLRPARHSSKPGSSAAPCGLLAAQNPWPRPAASHRTRGERTGRSPWPARRALRRGERCRADARPSVRPGFGRERLSVCRVPRHS